MENEDALIGQLRRLPDNQLVMIIEARADGFATVRRIGGERANTVAVCKVSDLRPKEPEM
jgi:hypothetical protein